MHPSDGLKAASELRRLVAVSADPHPVLRCTTPCSVVGASIYLGAEHNTHAVCSECTTITCF